MKWFSFRIVSVPVSDDLSILSQLQIVHTKSYLQRACCLPYIFTYHKYVKNTKNCFLSQLEIDLVVKGLNSCIKVNLYLAKFACLHFSTGRYKNTIARENETNKNLLYNIYINFFLIKNKIKEVLGPLLVPKEIRMCVESLLNPASQPCSR